MSEHDNIAIVRRMYTDVFDQQEVYPRPASTSARRSCTSFASSMGNGSSTGAFAMISAFCTRCNRPTHNWPTTRRAYQVDSVMAGWTVYRFSGGELHREPPSQGLA